MITTAGELLLLRGQAFATVDRLREQGHRLGEACAHASVDHQYPGGHEQLAWDYCRRDTPSLDKTEGPR